MYVVWLSYDEKPQQDEASATRTPGQQTTRQQQSSEPASVTQDKVKKPTENL
jgi:hypothetical protein